MKGLAGKKALVTGASSGIGQAIAIRMATEGADVVLNYRNGLAGVRDTTSTIAQLAPEVRTLAIQADVANETDVQRMFDTALDEFGTLDILVNNAGFQIQSPSHELPVNDFRRVIETNLTGAFVCSQHLLRHLLKHEKPGSIINISSVHEIVPKPMYAGYSASKGGMQNLTRTLALEYAPHGIRVNAVGPGATVTPINTSWINDAERRAVVESHIPMGRAGTSEEMAAAVAFLASDEAAYITGQTLFVDGGITLYPEFGTPWAS